jgi:hypothetical protein
MATNVLGKYDPIFYAQEGLIALEKALGLAGRIHRGFDAERRSFNKGQTISIRRPSVFTAAQAPSVAQAVATEYVDITLDQWQEVKFGLTDQELAYTGEQIINDHIRPAAYALADKIDADLCTLYKYIPWYYDLSGTPTVADVTGPRNVMFNNNVPVFDEANMHYMMCGSLAHSLMALSAFGEFQGAGQAGVETQQRGTLGRKFGMECFANQNTPTHTMGAMADPAGAVLAGGWLKGATTVTIDDLTDTQHVHAGDTFSIAGYTQRYAFTADTTVASNALTAVPIYPALKEAVSAEAVVTIRMDTHVANLAFHRNWAALAMAPLSEMGNELGAKIASITDPVTGLSLRSRIYYIGNSSEVDVALDVLYGYKILDGNLACRACG